MGQSVDDDGTLDPPPPQKKKKKKKKNLIYVTQIHKRRVSMLVLWLVAVCEHVN